MTIELVDKNDEIPQFVGLDENGRYPGSVSENMAPGAEVITVTATDRDMFPDYRKVSTVIRMSLYKTYLDAECRMSLTMK